MVSPIGSGGFDLSAMQARIQQQAQSQFQQKFSASDLDSSGGLSFEEFETAGADKLQDSARSADEIFAEIDSDNDGNLSEQELGSFAQEQISSRIQGNISQFQGQLSNQNVSQLLQLQESLSSSGTNLTGGLENDLIDSLFADDDE